jgi:hypothetical protein
MIQVKTDKQIDWAKDMAFPVAAGQTHQWCWISGRWVARPVAGAR